MLFLSKRDNSSEQSGTETCVSVLGLLLATGIIGGIAALVYGIFIFFFKLNFIRYFLFFFVGIIKGNSSGIIGGGVVLGVSVFFSIILALVFVFCLKNNNVNSNINEQRSHTNQRQYKQNRHQQQNRQIKHEHTSSHQITVISGVHKSNNHPQQQQSNEYGTKNFLPPYQRGGLADSTNSGYGKQIPQSPSKISSFAYSNQSNGSIHNQNYQSPTNPNIKQNNYNRH
jgi:hypothetical protein